MVCVVSGPGIRSEFLGRSWSKVVSRRTAVLAAILVHGAAIGARAVQTEPTEQTGPPPPATTPTLAPAPQPAPATADNLKQLDTCREGIIDANAREADRQRWAELLFTYDSPEAADLVVTLLSSAQAPPVRRTVCDAMTETIRAHPARAKAKYVPPLLDMLGVDEAPLRAAAAESLSAFPPAELAPQLGAIAADEKAPLNKRLAAIDALSRNTHIRAVVAQLVPLLKSESVEVRSYAAQRLEPASVETFGDDVARWQAWWKINQSLTDEQWLEKQLEIYRQRARAIEDRFEDLKRRTARDRESTINFVRTLQSELFRALPAEQRRAKLVEWLASPIGIVRLTALDLIKARIADEGQSPEGAVLKALVRLLLEGEGTEQREALLIVQNVNDPSVVSAVLSRLAVETDTTMRLALLTALGRMRDPAAIPALVAELQRPEATPAMVREAAASLGRIAERITEKQTLQAAIQPLKKRFEEADPDDTALRSALLSAMAGTGDRAFVPTYSEALNSDNPRILQPAIRGLRLVGDRTRLPRIRDLTGNSDPLVRLDAIKAVAELGRDAEDLQSLLIRLNPSIESNELAREAAWNGFRDYMSRRSLAERIDASQRLRDTPDLEARYLGDLAETMATTGSDPQAIERVRDRLATVLVGLGRFGEAAGHLRLLFQRQVDRGADAAFATGMRWLDATLHADPAGDVGEVLQAVAPIAKTEDERTRLTDKVAPYLEKLDVAKDPARARKLSKNLKSVNATGWPMRWSEAITAFADRFDGTSGAKAPK